MENCVGRKIGSRETRVVDVEVQGALDPSRGSGAVS